MSINVIDQNGALAELEQALVPGPSLLDGRTEKDWLCFLSEIGSLVNFYDNNNSINGNWKPFLLKDPVFLLANIAKLNVAALQSLYCKTCLKLEQLVQSAPGTDDMYISYSELFGQVDSLFRHIRQWVHFMQKSDDEYELKSWVIREVKTNFSKYFWAINSLQREILASSSTRSIELVELNQPHLFEPYEEIIWKQNKDKNPYWEVLGLKNPYTAETASDFYYALVNACDRLFHFLETITRQSAVEFEKAGKSKYPDTTLLRVFVKLLKIHQDQLNGIAHKHLHFYYKDILKQAILPAAPDSVFICADPAKKNATFDIPPGTLFDAGIDAQKNPILFATQEIENLNPATIVNAYTLSAITGTDGQSTLYLQDIPTPGVLQTDADGKIQTWETFGSSIPTPALLQTMGIAFASPMLLLREGHRTISLNLQFAANIDPRLLQQARYFLSTQKEWLEVTSSVTFPPVTVPGNTVDIDIDVAATLPPIEPFLKNPDGLTSSWSMMKIEFSSFPDLATPPVLTQLDIAVKVSNVRTFQLYNDFGALNTKTPYQVMGPLPLVNSSFMIGNNEIFSKPFDGLYIELDWSSLPTDFSVYYQPYNDYLSGNLAPITLPSLWQRFKCWLAGLFGHPCQSGPTVFNNVGFTVNFNLLQNNSWKGLGMTKLQDVAVSPENDIVPTPYQVDTGCAGCTPQAEPGLLLFSTTSSTEAKCVLTPTSYFGYGSPVAPPPPSTIVANAKTPDPSIQLTPLKLSDATTSGFMNMVLVGPGYGFGSELYPDVVSSIALQNALGISQSNSSSPPSLIPPAKLPFAPRVANLVAHYTASQTYVLSAATGTYPVQLFHYTPFANYPVYDNTSNDWNNNNALGSSLTGPGSPTSGVALYPSFNYTGALFLAIQNLILPGNIQLYFQLARNYGNGSPTQSIQYNYLGNTGWQSLAPLVESTNELSCPGLIKFAIPADCANQSPIMPGNNYWISMAVQDPVELFAQTAFLKTNGFQAQRTGTSFLASTEIPKIAASTISKTYTAMPQITSIIQPFPSFGGKAAEDHTAMHRRVSTRLKTKDRVIANEDYFRLIKKEYNDIYYVKPVFDPATCSTRVNVLKTYEDYTEPNALTPRISHCKQENIQAYLDKRASAFSNITVTDFDFQFVQVTAYVYPDPAFAQEGIRKKLVNELNLYLSPWINSKQSTMIIDTPVTDAEVAGFINSVEGISGVQSVSFQTWTVDPQSGQKKNIDAAATTIVQLTGSTLFVTGPNHVIDFVT